MKKTVQSVILSTFLLFGAVAPVLMQSPTVSYAAPKASSDDLSTIGDDFKITMGNGGQVSAEGTDNQVTDIFEAFVNFIRLLTGAGSLIMLMIFVLNFIKLGAAGTNAKARESAISALVWSGIATTCLSMSSVVFFFFFKMSKNFNGDGEQSSNR